MSYFEKENPKLCGIREQKFTDRFRLKFAKSFEEKSGPICPKFRGEIRPRKNWFCVIFRGRTCQIVWNPQTKMSQQIQAEIL